MDGDQKNTAGESKDLDKELVAMKSQPTWR